MLSLFLFQCLVNYLGKFLLCMSMYLLRLPALTPFLIYYLYKMITYKIIIFVKSRDTRIISFNQSKTYPYIKIAGKFTRKSKFLVNFYNVCILIIQK